MEPIQFKEANVVYAKDQPEYVPVPAYQMKDSKGQVIFCLKATWQERLQFLLTGKMWVSMLTFGDPLTPSFHSVFKHDMFLRGRYFGFQLNKTGFWFRLFGYGLLVTPKEPALKIKYTKRFGYYILKLQPNDFDVLQ